MAKWGSVDYSGFVEFQKKLQEFQKVDVDSLCRRASTELALRLLASVKRRTPVGKKPTFSSPKTAKVTGANGKAKSFLTKEGAILEQYWAGYKGGQLRDSWKIGKVKRSGSVFEIEVFNPVDYASYVEYGHRQRIGRYVPQIGKSLKKGWVDGRFMLTISEDKIRSIAPKILQKMLEEELRRVFNDN